MTGHMRIDGGAMIDRSRRISFTFDGRKYEGFSGDTLASALLANGVHLLARSFKYHRPRGVVSAGSEEPNALATVIAGEGRRTPNLRATMVELYDGLEAESQNRFPSLQWDLGAIVDCLSPIFGAGFYYKTFMWPRSFWKMLYEPAIRGAAGLGVAPTHADPDRYATRYAHCDVLVVGSGPAGLSAARAAAQAGEKVLLCDERAQFGGMLFDSPNEPIEGRAAGQWRRDTVEALREFANVRLLPRTTAFALYPGNFALLNERVTDHLASPDPRLPRERIWQVRAKRVVLATGAIEQPIVFGGNDRPGVMLSSAACSYAKRWGVIVGDRAVVISACDSAWENAFELSKAGVEIALIAELRADVHAELKQAAQQMGIPIALASKVGAAIGASRVRAVEVSGEHIACEAVLMGGGWAPAVHLYAQAGGKLSFDARHGVRIPDGTLAGVVCVGACNGGATTLGAIEEGRAAAAANESKALSIGRRFNFAPEIHSSDARARSKAFVDFQSDVTTKDIKLALQEGFRSVEHLKRYTTTGMGVDQGKISNLNALAIAAHEQGTAPSSLVLTTFRMPYTPVSFGAMAGPQTGALFEPLRKTPIDPWAAEAGAVFEPVGNWRRSRYFPKPGENMHAAIVRECRAVRSAVGIFDASTLGKVEVVGADAAEFLERIYVNRWRMLPVGRCRYGLMLRENGFIFDDGVVARIAEDKFHVTTTTGGVQSVLAHMEDYLQTEWAHLNVWLTDITEQWAVIALQGPLSRNVLTSISPETDFSDETMPHLSVRKMEIGGVPVRLFRVSFTGERGYEINAPAGSARAIWETLHERVKASGGCAYGTEAMHVLRAEKGYIIVGQETDGTVTLDDAGYGWMLPKDKPDFVGKRSLRLSGLSASGRKQLVGLHTEESSVVVEEGAQVTNGAGALQDSIGHVTSSYWSETLGRPIALALIEGGRKRLGERVFVNGIAARIVSPVHFDPEGARLHA